MTVQQISITRADQSYFYHPFHSPQVHYIISDASLCHILSWHDLFSLHLFCYKKKKEHTNSTLILLSTRRFFWPIFYVLRSGLKSFIVTGTVKLNTSVPIEITGQLNYYFSSCPSQKAYKIFNF